MNIEEAINKIKEVIYMSDGEKVDCIDINHSDLGGEVSVDIFIKAIETILTAYEKEKEKNKSLEQENSFLKMLYRGTDEFKAIENLHKEINRRIKLKIENEKIVDTQFIYKQKIKAKIEPVLKQLDIKMKEEYNKYGNSREYQDIVDAYNFLQSLLEKE